MNGSSSTVETALFTPESVGATLNALDLSLVCPLSNRLLCVRALIDAATPLATGEQDLRQTALLIRCIDAALPALFSGGSELSDAVTELLEVLLGALAAHSVRYEEQIGPSSLVAEAKLRMLQSASDLLGGAGSLPGAALPLLCMLLLLLKGKAATVAANALVEQSRITHVLVGAIFGDADSLERVALRVLAQTIVAHGACASSVLHRCGVDIDELLARLPHRGSAPPRRSLSLQMCELLAALAASDPQLAARICRPRPLDALKAPLISGDPLLQLAAVDVLAVLHSQGCTRALCTEDTVPFLLEACRPIGQGTDQAVDSAGVAPSATADQLEHLREQCVALLGELLHTPHPRCNSLLARLLEALHPSVAVRWADKLRCLRRLDASLRCAVALLEWHSPHPSEIPPCLDFCQAGAGLLGDCIDAGVADAAHASFALAGMGRLVAAAARGSSPAHAPALCHLCALLVPRSLGALHQTEEPAALAQLLPSTCELLAAMLCGSSLEGGERRALAHAHTRDCLWLLDLSSRQDGESSAAESSARLAIALLGALERVEPPGGQPGGVELTLPCTGLHSCIARVRAATDEVPLYSLELLLLLLEFARGGQHEEGAPPWAQVEGSTHDPEAQLQIEEILLALHAVPRGSLHASLPVATLLRLARACLAPLHPTHSPQQALHHSGEAACHRLQLALLECSPATLLQDAECVAWLLSGAPSPTSIVPWGAAATPAERAFFSAGGAGAGEQTWRMLLAWARGCYSETTTRASMAEGESLRRNLVKGVRESGEVGAHLLVSLLSTNLQAARETGDDAVLAVLRLLSRVLVPPPHHPPRSADTTGPDPGIFPMLVAAGLAPALSRLCLHPDVDGAALALVFRLLASSIASTEDSAGRDQSRREFHLQMLQGFHNVLRRAHSMLRPGPAEPGCGGMECGMGCGPEPVANASLSTAWPDARPGSAADGAARRELLNLLNVSLAISLDSSLDVADSAVGGGGAMAVPDVVSALVADRDLLAQVVALATPDRSGGGSRRSPPESTSDEEEMQLCALGVLVQLLRADQARGLADRRASPAAVLVTCGLSVPRVFSAIPVEAVDTPRAALLFRLAGLLVQLCTPSPHDASPPGALWQPADAPRVQAVVCSGLVAVHGPAQAGLACFLLALRRRSDRSPLTQIASHPWVLLLLEKFVAELPPPPPPPNGLPTPASTGPRLPPAACTAWSALLGGRPAWSGRLASDKRHVVASLVARLEADCEADLEAVARSTCPRRRLLKALGELGSCAARDALRNRGPEEMETEEEAPHRQFPAPVGEGATVTLAYLMSCHDVVVAC